MNYRQWIFVLAASVVLSTPQAWAESQVKRSIGVRFDNDILVPGSRDQDYTAGLSVRVSDNRVEQASIWHLPLTKLSQWLGLANHQDLVSRSHEVGLYGFTPEQTESTQASAGDRPYASILYWSTAQEGVDNGAKTAWQSILTLGVLGLDTFANVQRDVHKLTGSKDTNGWHNQISDGGEPTLRYQLARQRLLSKPSARVETKWGQQLSLGYLTEASVSISSRFGNLLSPWWRFRPELSSYGEQASISQKPANEKFIFAGMALKARAYNAFLQGQFRHSPVELDRGDLNNVLLEAWLGVSLAQSSGYQLSYVLRGHSSEVKRGAADRNLLWGGIEFNKTWDL